MVKLSKPSESATVTILCPAGMLPVSLLQSTSHRAVAVGVTSLPLLSAAELAICQRMGVEPKEFLHMKAERRARRGPLGDSPLAVPVRDGGAQIPVIGAQRGFRER
jgi:hypothetical protein